jgi:hypothetical protein
VVAGGGAVELPEAFEHVLDELGLDALAGVDDADLHMGFRALEQDLDPATPGGEFDGVGQQVPEHLL